MKMLNSLIAMVNLKLRLGYTRTSSKPGRVFLELHGA